ncbi:MAG: hypothetical protein ACYTEQ_19490 [Planctomycetota bacterium]|jgi:hypothetical protein
MMGEPHFVCRCGTRAYVVVGLRERNHTICTTKEKASLQEVYWCPRCGSMWRRFQPTDHTDGMVDDWEGYDAEL